MMEFDTEDGMYGVFDGLFEGDDAERETGSEAEPETETEAEFSAEIESARESLDGCDRLGKIKACPALVTDGERTVWAYDPDVQIWLESNERNSVGIATRIIASVYGLRYARANLRVYGDGRYGAYAPGAEYDITVYPYDLGVDRKLLPPVWKNGIWRMDADHIAVNGNRKRSVTRYWFRKDNFVRMIRGNDLEVIVDGAIRGKKWRTPPRAVKYFKLSNGITAESRRQTELLKRLDALGMLTM